MDVGGRFGGTCLHPQGRSVRLVGFCVHIWHPVLKSNGEGRDIDGYWYLIWVSRDSGPGKLCRWHFLRAHRQLCCRALTRRNGA
jgi:hypothetical protein